MSAAEPPLVRSQEEVEALGGDIATVQGTYEQQDVRMRQVEPDTLHAGHVAIVLADGVAVYLHPPGDAESIRDAAEIERFEHHAVRATGLLLPANPREGAAIDAPCLLDIATIELAEG